MNNLYLFGLPIPLQNNLGKIYQPKLKDFLGKHTFGEFVRSFSLTKETIFDEEKMPEDIKNFDVFFLFYAMAKENPIFLTFLSELIDSLSLLYQCDKDKIKVQIDNTKTDMSAYYIEIDEKYILNRDNYDYLCASVLNMLDYELQTQENGELSEIEKKFAKAKAKFEKEHKDDKKEGYSIFDLANYVIHADGTIYTYDTVKELTIYQLKNTCKLYQQKEGYNLFMDYKTSGNFKIEEDRPHWFFNKEE